MTDGRSSFLTRKASSARLRARWADPVQRALMLDAAEKGSRKAAEVVRKRNPTPTDPRQKSKFNLVRDVCGVEEARKAFGLTPTASPSPDAVAGSPAESGTLALVSPVMPAGTP